MSLKKRNFTFSPRLSDQENLSSDSLFFMDFSWHFTDKSHISIILLVMMEI